jgi:outer membrane lipoprotein-sorting protein
MKALISLLIIFCFGFGQTGFEIAKMVDDLPEPKDMSNQTKMILINKKGKTRSMTMATMSMDGNKKQITWFLEPKDEKGVAFLKIEHDKKDDEMRMWLPAFKKVRRISSKKKGDAFMGSDLSYEDLTNRIISENEYKRLDDEIIDGKECYVIEVRPNKSIESSYKKHISWIEKSTFMGIKEESYDKREELKKEKRYEFEKMKEYYLMKRVFVKDVQKNHSTEVIFSDIKVDTGIDSKLFQEKNLKRLHRIN